MFSLKDLYLSHLEKEVVQNENLSSDDSRGGQGTDMPQTELQAFSGKTLRGNYLLQETLGEGNFGVIFQYQRFQRA